MCLRVSVGNGYLTWKLWESSINWQKVITSRGICSKRNFKRIVADKSINVPIGAFEYLLTIPPSISNTFSRSLSTLRTLNIIASIAFKRDETNKNKNVKKYQNTLTIVKSNYYSKFSDLHDNSIHSQNASESKNKILFYKSIFGFYSESNKTKKQIPSFYPNKCASVDNLKCAQDDNLKCEPIDNLNCEAIDNLKCEQIGNLKCTSVDNQSHGDLLNFNKKNNDLNRYESDEWKDLKIKDTRMVSSKYFDPLNFDKDSIRRYVFVRNYSQDGSLNKSPLASIVHNFYIKESSTKPFNTQKNCKTAEVSSDDIKSNVLKCWPTVFEENNTNNCTEKNSCTEYKEKNIEFNDKSIKELEDKYKNLSINKNENSSNFNEYASTEKNDVTEKLVDTSDSIKIIHNFDNKSSIELTDSIKDFKCGDIKEKISGSHKEDNVDCKANKLKQFEKETGGKNNCVDGKCVENFVEKDMSQELVPLTCEHQDQFPVSAAKEGVNSLNSKSSADLTLTIKENKKDCLSLKIDNKNTFKNNDEGFPVVLQLLNLNEFNVTENHKINFLSVNCNALGGKRVKINLKINPDNENLSKLEKEEYNVIENNKRSIENLEMIPETNVNYSVPKKAVSDGENQKENNKIYTTVANKDSLSSSELNAKDEKCLNTSKSSTYMIKAADNLKSTSVDNLKCTSSVDNLKSTSVDNLTCTTSNDNPKSKSVEKLKSTSVDKLKSTLVDNFKSTSGDQLSVDNLNCTSVDNLKCTRTTSIDNTKSKSVDNLIFTSVDDLKSTSVEKLKNTLVDNLKSKSVDNLKYEENKYKFGQGDTVYDKYKGHKKYVPSLQNYKQAIYLSKNENDLIDNDIILFSDGVLNLKIAYEYLKSPKKRKALRKTLGNISTIDKWVKFSDQVLRKKKASNPHCNKIIDELIKLIDEVWKNKFKKTNSSPSWKVVAKEKMFNGRRNICNEWPGKKYDINRFANYVHGRKNLFQKGNIQQSYGYSSPRTFELNHRKSENYHGKLQQQTKEIMRSTGKNIFQSSLSTAINSKATSDKIRSSKFTLQTPQTKYLSTMSPNTNTKSSLKNEVKILSENGSKQPEKQKIKDSMTRKMTKLSPKSDKKENLGINLKHSSFSNIMKSKEVLAQQSVEKLKNFVIKPKKHGGENDYSLLYTRNKKQPTFPCTSPDNKKCTDPNVSPPNEMTTAFDRIKENVAKFKQALSIVKFRQDEQTCREEECSPTNVVSPDSKSDKKSKKHGGENDYSLLYTRNKKQPTFQCTSPENKKCTDPNVSPPNEMTTAFGRVKENVAKFKQALSIVKFPQAEQTCHKEECSPTNVVSPDSKSDKKSILRLLQEKQEKDETMSKKKSKNSRPRIFEIPSYSDFLLKNSHSQFKKQ